MYSLIPPWHKGLSLLLFIIKNKFKKTHTYPDSCVVVIGKKYYSQLIQSSNTITIFTVVDTFVQHKSLDFHGENPSKTKLSHRKLLFRKHRKLKFLTAKRKISH
uniref:Uncharacterized protein n=1 Tax=Cacopsylla melanoneura TaxID=428564 RepID=A0A8D8ZXM9_9HEMI